MHVVHTLKLHVIYMCVYVHTYMIYKGDNKMVP